jgi:hypothetical protein
MDVEKLGARLKTATLVLGPIADTLAGYCAAEDAMIEGFTP